MLIAISGSQGAGKTTILNRLADFGYDVVQRKTARSVLTEMFPGKTLSEIYANPELVLTWQTEILMRKSVDEAEALDSKGIWFTERTYADLFTYAVMAIGKDNAHSNWVDNYYDTCSGLNQKYTHTFYVNGGYFTPENDGVRGINQHYSRMIDTVMWDNTVRMSSPKLSIIDTPSIEGRLDEILEYINSND